MSVAGDVIEVFEGQAKRIFWMPAITLGYIYTLTGNWIQFALAVVSIAAAKYFVDINRKRESYEYLSDELVIQKIFNLIANHYSKRKLVLTLGFVLFYAISLVYSLALLFEHFNHNDPVLVGLSAVYLAIGLILLHS